MHFLIEVQTPMEILIVIDVGWVCPFSLAFIDLHDAQEHMYLWL